MKILKYILFAIGGIIVVVLAIGLLKPSVSYGHRITVNKPVEEVWAITQDESKYDQWLEGFKSIELIEGEQNEIGSKYRVIVNPGEGQDDFEMTQTLLAMEEFEHASFHFGSDFMDFEQEYHFSETNGTTTFETKGTVIGKGILNRAMFAIMEITTGSFTAQEVKNIEALKKVVEENTTDYYPEPEEGGEEESEE